MTRLKQRAVALATLALLAACGEAPTVPTVAPQADAVLVGGPLANAVNEYVSGTAFVTTYDPIYPVIAYPDPGWQTSVCVGTPAVGLNANWTNPHPAYSGFNHDWLTNYFTAGWINAWSETVFPNKPVSKGPGGQSWTKYDTQVQGNGNFVVSLLADNCSWIYLDGTLVGVQPAAHNATNTSYGLTLNGTHTLSFIIFDGGGLAGGKFRLQTTTTPPPPLDTDKDGVPNQTDPEPYTSNFYYYVDWTAANASAGTASGTITIPNKPVINVNLRVLNPDGSPGTFYAGGTQTACGNAYWTGGSTAPTTHTSPSVLNGPSFPCDLIALIGGSASKYQITFSEPIKDPVMAVHSLGQAGRGARYDFDRQFSIVSSGPGWHMSSPSSHTLLRQDPGEVLYGEEGYGTLRFIGSFSTFSWTAPFSEVWHGFTIGINGTAAMQPSSDFDGDGVPDAADNCPQTPNGDQADLDGDGIGDACDSVDDSTADPDGDGLTNAEERVLGTHPLNPDTDGDGVNDKLDECPLDPSCQSLDNTPPTITPTVTGTLGTNGWYTSNVGVLWTVTDGESPVTSPPCLPGGATTDTPGATFTCSATSAGGTASASVTLKRDATAPTISAAISAGTLGANGWYTGPVTVHFTCADGGSGVASCPADQTLSNQGTSSSTAGTATDAAGNTSAPSNVVSVNIDGVKPVIAFGGNAGSYSVDQSVNITCAATDATSGVAASTCPGATGDAYTFGVGSHTLNASATDNAGNQHSASTSFTVTVNSGNICELVKRWVDKPGVANSMCQQLKNKAYGAFINHVGAQSGKSVTAARAAILISLAKLL